MLNNNVRGKGYPLLLWSGMRRFLFFINCLLIVLNTKASTLSRKSGDSLRDISISVKAVFGERDLLLDESEYVLDSFDTIQVEHFKLYISSLELVYSNGKVYKEKASYHLINAEEPSSMHFNIKGVPRGSVVAIRFNIGVDSLMSVSGAMAGDLDPRWGMYWAWNSGYINAKLEGACSTCKGNHHRFEYHIGGYSGKENALRKVSLPLTLLINKSNHITLIADVATWLRGMHISDNCSIMIPGAAAMKMASQYAKMFRVVSQ